MEVKECCSIFKYVLILKMKGFFPLVKTTNAAWNLRSNYAASAFKKSLPITNFS